MATVFSHSLIGATLGSLAPQKIKSKKFYFWMAFLPVVPDFDSVAFVLRIPYESFWGHRGFTHSIVFSLFLAVITTLLASSGLSKLQKAQTCFFFFLASISHALVDALTNGGLGVALFSPFSNERLFFSFRPIQVSPIGMGFFSERGLKVLLSEVFWIVLPCTVILIFNLFRKKKNAAT